MKKSWLKKVIALATLFALALPMSVPVFASNEDTGIEPFANRYDYVTKKGTEKLIYTVTKTPDQLRTEAMVRNTIDGVCDVVALHIEDPALAVSALVISWLANGLADIRGYGEAATIKVYTRTDIRYRVDSLTGERVADRTTYNVIYYLYRANSSKPYDSWTESSHR